MLSPRWNKVLRDSWISRGRMTLMAAAMGVSLIGVGAVLSAYAILTREISRNYLGTRPASATLELDRPAEALASAAAGQPGVLAAEARGSVLARFRDRNGEWRPLLLLAVRDFRSMRLATFRPQSGAWPPPANTLLLERAVLPLFKVREGDALTVKTPNGPVHALTVSGTVHDPGLAPAWQERMGYGYITLETLAGLGETTGLNELKVIFQDHHPTLDATTRKALALAQWVRRQGCGVREIQVPPPEQHPHQGQMTAILSLLLVFSLLGLALSAILTATVVSGMMAKEIRQIGVMKAVGGRTLQIAVLYLVLILIISAGAMVLGIPLGAAAGRVFSRAVARMLNFTLYSQNIPGWVLLVQITAGLIAPLLLSLAPILRASRMTVQAAISDFGVPPAQTAGRFLTLRFGWIDRTLLLAIRNAFRRRGRLLLTLGLLAAGGAMFMTARNVSVAWDRNLSDAFKTRAYDYEIRMNRLEPMEQVSRLIRSVKGVRAVEAWGFAPAGRTQPEGIEVTRTYPDQGHGSLSLRGVPTATRLVSFPVLAGRWLAALDTEAVVLNQMACLQFPGTKVGARLSLTAGGRPRNYRLVGIVKEIGPAAAYITETAFEQSVARSGQARAFRIVTREKVMPAVEQALEEAGVSVGSVIPDSEYRNAITDHIYILIFSLMFLAVLMGIVGLLGLTSMTSTAIVERTREIGVMRSLGATPAVILRNIVSEAVFIGVLSLAGAGLFALPLSLGVGALLGNLAFQTPLPLAISVPGVWIWLGTVIAGSAAASGYPAWIASRMTIRETLAYE